MRVCKPTQQATKARQNGHSDAMDGNNHADVPIRGHAHIQLVRELAPPRRLVLLLHDTHHHRIRRLHTDSIDATQQEQRQQEQLVHIGFLHLLGTHSHRHVH